MEVNLYTLELSGGIPALIAEKSYICEGLLDDPDKVAALCSQLHLQRQAEEHVLMIALSIAMRPIGIFELSHGTSTLSLTNPKGAFQRALLCGANQILIVHNHPSGSLDPSNEDLLSCQKFIDLGKNLEVPIADFLIVSSEGHRSFRSEYSDQFVF